MCVAQVFRYLVEDIVITKERTNDLAFPRVLENSWRDAKIVTLEYIFCLFLELFVAYLHSSITVLAVSRSDPSERSIGCALHAKRYSYNCDTHAEACGKSQSKVFRLWMASLFQHSHSSSPVHSYNSSPPRHFYVFFLWLMPSSIHRFKRPKQWGGRVE